eukprot:2903380-Rhodomonas_salina.1
MSGACDAYFFRASPMYLAGSTAFEFLAEIGLEESSLESLSSAEMRSQRVVKMHCRCETQESPLMEHSVLVAVTPWHCCSQF